MAKPRGRRTNQREARASTPRSAYAHGVRANGHRNVADIADLEHKARASQSRFERISAAISRTTGSLPFFVGHIAWFSAWLIVNSGWTPIPPFDPYPFNFLTMTVSLEAIFLTNFVLMAQNVQTRDADRRAQLNLQIDLLAEQESTATLRMAHALSRAAGIHVPIEHSRLKELLYDTNISEVAKDLKARLER